MADKIIEKDQSEQTDIESLLRQSVLLPSQRKAFDRYMAESTNEQQKQEFQDVLNEIEKEVLQTYEEYRYTGKPVAEFLKWKDKEIAPLAKVLTDRVNALYKKEFGYEEEIGEAGRDLPEDPSEEEAEQEDVEKKDKEESEETDKEIEEAQERTANGYTKEENELWEKSLERRAEKQKEWEQFLQNRRDAEKQAERDEELFRDHPEYFFDPYQDAADEAEREAELEAEQELASNRQYLDAETKAEEARFARGTSSHQIDVEKHNAESGVAGIEVTRKDNHDSFYAGEMLQNMLDGRLDRASSKSSSTVEKPVSSKPEDESYVVRVKARTDKRKAQHFAQEQTNKYGFTNGSGSKSDGASKKSNVSASSKTRHDNAFITGEYASAIDEQSAIVAKKKSETEMDIPGVAAVTSEKIPNHAAAVSDEVNPSDAIRTLKRDKSGIRTQMKTDQEAAKEYAARITAAYRSGASVLPLRRISHKSDSAGDGVIGAGVGTVVKAGQVAAKGAVFGIKKSQQAFREGAEGSNINDSSSIENAESEILRSTARNIRARIINSSENEHIRKKNNIRYVCPKCGRKYDVMMGFCPYCGAAKGANSSPVSSRRVSSAFTVRAETHGKSSGFSVEDSTAQVQEGSSGRSVIHMTSKGFVKKNHSNIFGKAAGSIAGGSTEGASIVGAGGVIAPGVGTVAQIGQMAVKGAAFGIKKSQQAFREGAEGSNGNNSSSTEKTESKKIQSAAHTMREKIINSAGNVVGTNNSIKTAVNSSFRVVQKFSSTVKNGQDENSAEDDNEGTSNDPKAVEEIWRKRVRMNKAATKKIPWSTILGSSAGVTGGIVNGTLAFTHPLLFLLVVAIIIVVILTQLGMNAFLHQVDASLPAAGRYNMSGEEVGDYLDDNGTYAEDDNTDTITTETATGTWTGAKLTKEAGRIVGPSGGEETYYNMNMDGVISIMRGMGNNDRYWIRDDGVKMLGDYVMVAANFSVHPRGSKVETSLGTGIVCDTGGFAADHPQNLDIAVDW